MFHLAGASTCECIHLVGESQVGIKPAVLQFRLVSNRPLQHWTNQRLLLHLCVSFRPLYSFWPHQQRKKKLRAFLQEPAQKWSQRAVGEGIYQNTPRPPHTTTFSSSTVRRECERERLAGWRRRAVPSPLMFPSSSTRSSGEDNPVCAPVCQFTGPKWHCWEESMFLS